MTCVMATPPGRGRALVNQARPKAAVLALRASIPCPSRGSPTDTPAALRLAPPPGSLPTLREGNRQGAAKGSAMTAPCEHWPAELCASGSLGAPVPVKSRRDGVISMAQRPLRK